MRSNCDDEGTRPDGVGYVLPGSARTTFKIASSSAYGPLRGRGLAACVAGPPNGHLVWRMWMSIRSRNETAARLSG